MLRCHHGHGVTSYLGSFTSQDGGEESSRRQTGSISQLPIPSRYHCSPSCLSGKALESCVDKTRSVQAEFLLFLCQTLCQLIWRRYTMQSSFSCQSGVSVRRVGLFSVINISEAFEIFLFLTCSENKNHGYQFQNKLDRMSTANDDCSALPHHGKFIRSDEASASTVLWWNQWKLFLFIMVHTVKPEDHYQFQLCASRTEIPLGRDELLSSPFFSSFTWFAHK